MTTAGWELLWTAPPGSPPGLESHAASACWEAGTLGVFVDEDGRSLIAGFDSAAAAGRGREAVERSVGGTVTIRESTPLGPSPVSTVEAAGHTIRLEPGHAFGHGSHPTTALCLEWLIELLSAAPPAARVLDLGSGSGVLAIAAAALGAREVWAVDNDPAAITATTANATLNGVEVEIRDDLAAIPTNTAFDLVVANLLLRDLGPLAGPLNRLLASHSPDHAASPTATGSQLVVSGFLQEQEAQVLELFPGLELGGRRHLPSSGGSRWEAIHLVPRTNHTAAPRRSQNP